MMMTMLMMLVMVIIIPIEKEKVKTRRQGRRRIRRRRIRGDKSIHIHPGMHETQREGREREILEGALKKQGRKGQQEIGKTLVQCKLSFVVTQSDRLIIDSTVEKEGNKQTRFFEIFP